MIFDRRMERRRPRCDLRAIVATALIATGLIVAIDVRDIAAAPCDRPGALGVSRVIDIDPSGGPHFGDVSRNPREPTFLAAREVVLTFDDGPMPGLTRQILDTLDRHCARATFFHVGRMAIAYPGLVREVIARGHTVGTHTWSHPLNLRRYSAAAAQAEIEKGFAAVTLAAGQPIAPFFRFPGLNDTPELLTYLQGRGAATFTVDVISDDSFIQSPERLIETTLKRLEARNGGIVLFHDIKASTARALPTLLTELHTRGFRIVHLQSATRFQPDQAALDTVRPLMARADPARPAALATAFARPLDSIPITRLAPAPRAYGVTRFAAVMDRRRAATKVRTVAAMQTTAAAIRGPSIARPTLARPAVASQTSAGPMLASPWSTQIKRTRGVSTTP